MKIEKPIVPKSSKATPSMLLDDILIKLGEIDQKVDHLIEALHEFRYKITKPATKGRNGGRYA